MCMSVVTQSIEHQGERTDGGKDREQNGCGAERLAAGDIEGGDAGGQGRLHEGMVLGFSGVSRVGHTDSVDAPITGSLPGKQTPLNLRDSKYPRVVTFPRTITGLNPSM